MYPMQNFNNMNNPMAQQINNLQNQYQQHLQSLQQPIQQMQPQYQSIQYVNGRQSADSYVVQPNSTVLLMDQNLPRFYIKQADASGYSTVKSYDFVEAKEEVSTEYASKAEFDSLRNEIAQYKEMFSNMQLPATKSNSTSQKGKAE